MSDQLTIKSMTKTCEKYDIKVTDSIHNFLESIERCPKYNGSKAPFEEVHEHLCCLCMGLGMMSATSI